MMIHKYKLAGLTCNSCVAKVKSALLVLPDVYSADVSRDSATIFMEKHIPLGELQRAIGEAGQYQIDADDAEASRNAMNTRDRQTWLQTYKPLLLIVSFVAIISLLTSRTIEGIDAMLWMNYFMAGIFIVFSFFKFLDLKGFADSYAMYDVLAKRWKPYGYVYPFIELALGIMFLVGFNHQLTNVVTALVMGFSSIGVIQSVLDKKKIRCACLGAVFNLPMSTVTIVEDLMMVAMSVTGLIWAA